jgi:hypothetical protein
MSKLRQSNNQTEMLKHQHHLETENFSHDRKSVIAKIQALKLQADNI